MSIKSSTFVYMIKIRENPVLDNTKYPEGTPDQLLCNCTSPTFFVYQGSYLTKIVCSHCGSEYTIQEDEL